MIDGKSTKDFLELRTPEADRVRGGSSHSEAIGVPFDVVGRDLHYRPPFQGFVDELEPAGDHYLGRATFRGRRFGRFVLTRIS